MSNLHRARRRLMIAMIVFAVLDVIAVALLLSPLVLSTEARQERLNALQAQIQSKIRVVIPPDQVQTRIEEARKQIADFYRERLPSESSAISAELGKLATQQNVTLTQAKYSFKDTEIPGLQLVSIDAALDGNYLQEVRFVNALERSQLFFLVDSITLGETTGGKVRLELKLETYLKGQA